MFTAKPLMLLTSNLKLGVFDFREKKKYTENFLYSSEFRRKMRPRYVFEIKKPTKSASYQSPLKYEVGRKMGPKRNLKKKAASLHSETVLKNIIIINLKNLTTNNQQNLLLFILHKLVSLIQTVIQSVTTIHVNLGVDRLIQALNERIHGL